MQFLLFICNDPSGEDDSADAATIEEWFEGVTRSGVKHLAGDRLRPQSEAKTVRRRKGKTLVTDGPWADTKERVGGFDLIECDTIEQAVAVAAKHPMAQFGCVDVRPLWPFD